MPLVQDSGQHAFGANAMASAKPMTKHTANRRAFAPRLFPIRITPFLHGVKREWLTACLQQTTAGSFPAFFYTGGVDLCQCISCFSGDFPLFFACFGPENFITVPNQHHTFSDLREGPGNTGPPPLPGALSHIHSKTACRGALATCGALPRRSQLPLPKNRRKHWVFAGFLFARVVWEWGSLWFRHLVFPSVRTCSQPLPPPQAPKTHPTSAIFA